MLKCLCSCFTIESKERRYSRRLAEKEVRKHIQYQLDQENQSFHLASQDNHPEAPPPPPPPPPPLSLSAQSTPVQHQILTVSQLMPLDIAACFTTLKFYRGGHSLRSTIGMSVKSRRDVSGELNSTYLLFLPWGYLTKSRTLTL